MTSPGTSAAPVRLAPMSAAAPALPARQIRGVLVELAGPGTVHHVYEGRNTIGRDPDSSDIVLDEPRISKLHAILVIEQDQAILLDAASANGTRVDGVELRHDKATLPAQSLLQFDERAFAFLFIPQAMFAKLS
jgi:S-DNA-T family DNA segregation ATPase FtsK/SpoIIIE